MKRFAAATLTSIAMLVGSATLSPEKIEAQQNRYEEVSISTYGYKQQPSLGSRALSMGLKIVYTTASGAFHGQNVGEAFLNSLVGATTHEACDLLPVQALSMNCAQAVNSYLVNIATNQKWCKDIGYTYVALNATHDCSIIPEFSVNGTRLVGAALHTVSGSRFLPGTTLLRGTPFFEFEANQERPIPILQYDEERGGVTSFGAIAIRSPAAVLDSLTQLHTEVDDFYVTNNPDRIVALRLLEQGIENVHTIQDWLYRHEENHIIHTDGVEKYLGRLTDMHNLTFDITLPEIGKVTVPYVELLYMGGTYLLPTSKRPQELVSYVGQPDLGPATPDVEVFLPRNP